MSDTVIRVENLGKKYIIGRQKQEKYFTLRDAIANRARSLTQKIQMPPFGKSNSTPVKEEFWALKDVSFEIKQGDRVGIIGRNGAGKSTLLKILSRITEPTKGSISIKGRVASLLEVGTGFHPELTGRENIFLNGAILGMGKVEIQRKFDEIVAFSEVEKFLDTPVKRYSSGMYVRLAFAVAAHLEPEILIVDEVLAVGDAQFQKKCLGKMEKVGKEGRTVLFVSHNMAAVSSLCNIAILLEQGGIKAKDLPKLVIDQYFTAEDSLNLDLVKSSNNIKLKNLCLYDYKKLKTNNPIFNDDYFLYVNLESEKKITSTTVLLKVFDAFGVLVSSICSLEEGVEPFILHGIMEIEFFLPKLKILPGQYFMGLYIYRLGDAKPALFAENIFSFEVQPSMVNNASWAYRKEHGIVRLANKCTLKANNY